MQSLAQALPVGRSWVWSGRIVSALAVLFLVFDGVIKVAVLAPVVDSFGQLGYPVEVAMWIGLLELACIAVYLLPRTALLGAVLLTGYLGGAIASHVRVGSEPFSLLFPVIIGALLWGGLYLRDRRVRAMLRAQ